MASFGRAALARAGVVRRALLAFFLLLGASLATGCTPGGGESRAQGPDHIFVGGTVLTMDRGRPVAEAIAVRGEAIVAVGSRDDVLATATTGTAIHELDGRTLMPGFIAAHEHPTLSAVFGGVTDVSGFRLDSSQEVWRTIRDAVAAAPDGEWVYAMGIDPILVPDLEMPTLAKLDEVGAGHPLVVVAQTMHSFWANSRALAEAGITRHTPDPGNGSFYGRDANGDLDGFVSENAAAKPLLAGLREPLRVLRRYEQGLDDLRAAGFTTVASLGYTVPPWLARYAASRHWNPGIRQFLYLAADDLGYLPSEPDRDETFLRVQGVKLWHDGSPYTGSMVLAEPYLDTPLSRALGIRAGSSGEAMTPRARLEDELRRYAERGWQVAIHSQGDLSNREVLAALAAVPDRADLPPRRIEHCVLLPLDVLPELARLRVTPSFHINHLFYYGDALADSLLGSERAGRMLPVRSAFEAGLRPTLHADSPMFPPDPFHLMQTAILRRTSSGRTIGAGEAITIEQALEAMTVNGAWQLGVDDRLGSLAVGRQADLQVLSQNPLSTPPERLREIRTTELWVAGRRQVLPQR